MAIAGAVIAHVPNLISLIRLGAVPVVVWAIATGRYATAFWLFVAAGVSDALDGFIAKKFDAASKFGAWLDPIADKTLLVGVYVALVVRGHLPLWLVMLVVFRELVIVGGALLVQAMTQRLEMQPLLVSKINTAAQIALAAYVLADLAFGFAQLALSEAAIFAVAATTLISGAAYVAAWWRKVNEWERGDPR